MTTTALSTRRQPSVVRRRQRPESDIVTLPRTHAVPLWEEAVAAYLRDCRRRNLSPTTIEQYRWALDTGNRVRIWREGYDVVTAADLTSETLRGFETDLTEAGVKASTVATIHRRLCSFAAWCDNVYGVGGDVRNVEPPMEPSREPETYSEADLYRILACCPSDRDRLILRVLLHTGLRVAELANLDCDDVVTGPDGAWLHVRQGKGRKDRIVPLDSPDCRLSDLIQAHVRKHRRQSSSQRLLLTDVRDANGNYQPLAKAGIQALLRRLSDATGLRVHAHAFRHTFATRAIAAGVNPLVLQRVLGHSTLRMVSYYVHMQPFDLLDAWSRRTN